MENLQCFDKIVMSDVVEHIEQDMLEKILEKMSNSLSPKGVVVIHTAPNKDYYDITYPKIREQASSLGCFMPKNPRSYYEQLMHINEQSPNKLELTLKKYFSYVKVWTGMAMDIDLNKTLLESQQDNRIFAYASNNEEAMENIVRDIMKYSEKPVKDACKINIESDETITMMCEEAYIRVVLENMGSELITSRKKYPINLAYHILDVNGEVLLFDGDRTRIMDYIQGGEKSTIQMKIAIPEELLNGTQYIIRITCVAEGCFWFDEDGGNLKDIVLLVK